MDDALLARRLSRRDLCGAGMAGTAVALTGCAPSAPAPHSRPSLTLDGRVVTDADADYESWRTGVVWQDRKPDRRPAMIVRPRTAQAVADALRYARENALKVAVKSSGHHVWANFLRDGGMLIDMWDFRRVALDDDGVTAWVEPSAWGADVARVLGARGRAFPVAHCGSVGMGGFLLGGGVGQNWRSWGGLSAYSMLGAEVVTADGKVRIVDDANDPDLAWALRGGGNGFPAVVTRYRLKTYPAPRVLKMSSYVFPLSAAGDAARWVQELAAAGAIPKCEPLIILAHSPMAPPDAPPGRSKVCIVIFNVFADSETEAAAILNRVAAHPRAASALARNERKEWRLENSLYDTLDPRGPFNLGRMGVDTIWTARIAEALTPLTDAFVKAPTPGCHVVISHLDRPMAPANAAARVPGDFFIGIYSVALDAEADARAIPWLREASKSIQPFAAGHYMNETDAESGPGKIRGCFGQEGWRKLAAVRKHYDPDGVFHDFFAMTRG